MFTHRSSSLTRATLRNTLVSFNVSKPSHSAIPWRRSMRLKPQSGPTAAARYDRYLRVLEGKFEEAKARRDAEEARESESGEAGGAPQKKLDVKAEAKRVEKELFDSENADFWEHTLSDTQKALLKAVNIKTFSELCECATYAEEQMQKAPFPALKQLRPRLRHAYLIYKETVQPDGAETISSD